MAEGQPHLKEQILQLYDGWCTNAQQKVEVLGLME